ncbi:DUF3991 and TOPRIM domain-containing protein [Blastopirellula marina]|uniref:DUF3991 and TOPRIM domain-containing protein n=1 Tax=Blastopirellula marina TaxID=124 RepID=UPI0002F7E18D|nr:DUF3991 and TOPRIM domain-containing protein [Blastopirellula marina]
MTEARRTDELEDFKSQINFCQYASSRGFTLDPKQSSRSSAVMRHANGDKLIVARSPNRHWIYFNVHDSRDRGTIIDFVQIRDRLSLGEVRKELRPWIGRHETITVVKPPSFPELTPVEHDVTRVLDVWIKAQSISGSHVYLEQMRKIPPAVLSDPIFADRIRIDDRGNALFPHFGGDGLCGFEIKNNNFTGFSPGGVKGLWCSRLQADDRKLVICETAIDALSYAALFGAKRTRLVSTAGQISPVQAKLLQSAAEKLPCNGEIVLAMDNDPGGRQLVETISGVLAEIDLTNKLLVVRQPDVEGEDWNDVLKRTGWIFPASPVLG